MAKITVHPGGFIKRNYIDELSLKATEMPVISMFYGIVIRMYFLEDAWHGTPHIHARYAPHDAYKINPL